MNLSKATNKFMLFFLVYSLFFPIALIILLSAAGFDLLNANTALMNVVMTANIFLVPSVFFIFFTGKSLKELIPHKGLDIIDVILIVLISAMMMVYSGFFGALADFFTINDVGESISDETLEYSFAVMAFSVGIAPAVLEEFVFRGIILSGYKRAGKIKAIFLSGLFFGMMHMNFYQLFYTFPLGIILAVLTFYSGSILASMLSHFIINFSQITMAYIFMANNPLTESTQEVLEIASFDDKMVNLLAMIPICTIITPFFIMALKVFISRHKAYTPYFENNYTYKGCNDASNISNEKEPIFDLFFVLIFLFYIIYIILEEKMKL